jgi:hypothetical protein
MKYFVLSVALVGCLAAGGCHTCWREVCVDLEGLQCHSCGRYGCACVRCRPADWVPRDHLGIRRHDGCRGGLR